ncbi:TetR/AcrR family transcriptional regulator [Propioniciclava soli]|uniref:TetR/AcrR family transcriptional regulator n=1 Tax=Propioniciclava soli TaxID=2775081 RepID=A0ABZ3C696_9ACTN|nr:TetR/AcrR family transcriptional regulator [Propioniciclava soli]
MSTEAVSPRRAVTREKLCVAAMEVIAEKGVLGASVEAICDAAGFTRGAFYSNFSSRDELCVAIMERQLQRNLAALAGTVALAAGATTTDELVDGAVRTFLATQPSDRTSVLVSQELQLYAAREPEFAPAYSAMHRRGLDTVARVLTDALAGLAHELSTSPTQAMGILFAVFTHGEVTALIDGDHLDNAQRTERLTQVVRSLVRPVSRVSCSTGR